MNRLLGGELRAVTSDVRELRDELDRIAKNNIEFDDAGMEPIKGSIAALGAAVAELRNALGRVERHPRGFATISLSDVLGQIAPVPLDDGPWVLDPKGLTLTHRGGYWIDLERCRTSAELLDWIMQLSTKGWLPDEELGGLVRRLDDALGGVQSRYCALGKDRGRVDVKTAVRDAIEGR